MRSRFHCHLLAVAEQRHRASRQRILDRTLLLAHPAPCAENCTSIRAYNRTAATCGKCFCLHRLGHGSSYSPSLRLQPNRFGRWPNTCMGALTDQSLHSFVPSVGSEDRAGQANCEADAAQEETRGTPCTAFAALILLYVLHSTAAFTNLW